MSHGKAASWYLRVGGRLAWLRSLVKDRSGVLSLPQYTTNSDLLTTRLMLNLKILSKKQDNNRSGFSITRHLNCLHPSGQVEVRKFVDLGHDDVNVKTHQMVMPCSTASVCVCGNRHLWVNFSIMVALNSAK